MYQDEGLRGAGTFVGTILGGLLRAGLGSPQEEQWRKYIEAQNQQLPGTQQVPLPEQSQWWERFLSPQAGISGLGLALHQQQQRIKEQVALEAERRKNADILQRQKELRDYRVANPTPQEQATVDYLRGSLPARLAEQTAKGAGAEAYAAAMGGGGGTPPIPGLPPAIGGLTGAIAPEAPPLTPAEQRLATPPAWLKGREAQATPYEMVPKTLGPGGPTFGYEKPEAVRTQEEITKETAKKKALSAIPAAPGGAVTPAQLKELNAKLKEYQADYDAAGELFGFGVNAANPASRAETIALPIEALKKAVIEGKTVGGLRITQAELNQMLKGRSIGESLEAMQRYMTEGVNLSHRQETDFRNFLIKKANAARDHLEQRRNEIFKGLQEDVGLPSSYLERFTPPPSKFGLGGESSGLSPEAQRYLSQHPELQLGK